MPYLLIALLAALGYWGYTRTRSGMPLLPGATRTPEQVVAADVPTTLSKEVLDLYYNGRNAQAMHAAASELEKYGFFDAARLLHKRAEVLSGAPPSDEITPSGSMPGGIVLTPPVQIPSTPIPTNGGTAQPAQPMQSAEDVRYQILALDQAYSAFEASIRSPNAPIYPSEMVQRWTQWLAQWRSFRTDILNSTNLNLTEAYQYIASFRQSLRDWQNAFQVEADRAEAQAAAARRAAEAAAAAAAAAQAAAQSPIQPFSLAGTEGIVLPTLNQPLKVYDAPSVFSREASQISPGGVVTILDETEPGSITGFYQVRYGRATGWVQKAYIRPTTPSRRGSLT